MPHIAVHEAVRLSRRATGAMLDVVSVEDYVSFNSAISSIGSSTTTTLVINVTSTITANVTVTSNITLWFVGAGQLSINSGVTVTINGPIIAQSRQIFSGSGNAVVSTLQPAQVVWFSTGGTGTSASPWTGYEAGVNNAPVGSRIHFGAGYYRPASTINLRTDWAVTGDGRATVISPTSATINLFTGSSVSRVVLDNFGVDGPNPAAGGEETGNIVHMTSCTDCEVRNIFGLEMNGGITFVTCTRVSVRGGLFRTLKVYGVYILGSTDVIVDGLQILASSDMNTGIQTQLSGATRSEDVLITNCRIDVNASGIALRSTDRVTVSDNTVESTAPSAFTNAISTNDVFDAVIEDNIARGGGASSAVIYVADSSNRIKVADNIVLGAGRDGIQFGSSGTLIGSVTGNLIRGGGLNTNLSSGIRLDFGGVAAVNLNLLVANNTVESFLGRGINLVQSPGARRLRMTGNVVNASAFMGISIDRAIDSVVTDNSIIGCCTGGDSNGVYLDADRTRFADNIIINTASANSRGVNVLGDDNVLDNNTATQQGVTTQDYGIRIQSGNRHQLINNWLEGNQVGPVQNSGTDTSYRKEGQLTVTFSATPTFDVSRGDVFNFGAMTANVTAITLSNAVRGQRFSIIFLQDGTGGRTVAGWPAGTLLSGAAFTPTGTANARSILEFEYDGTNYVEIGRNLDVR